MKVAILVIIILISSSSFTQDKKYWKEGISYNYSALFISEKGDTLSNETIIVTPKDTIFNYNQTLVIYHFLSKNIELKSRTDSILGFNNLWVDSIGEGAYENHRLWIHPFRSNQYILTELAPFPNINLSPSIGIKWKSSLKLPSHWGNFSGEVKNKYKIVAKESRKYVWGNEDNCWKTESIGKHNRLGKSYLTTYFKEEYGFLEMNYHLFNGDSIKFKLIKLNKSLPNKT
tara:strand:- start:124 stop:813 length:690 start_codon:yes stop_codon:yes gene_type:complete